jgi:lysophospholipase L1-like esterase
MFPQQKVVLSAQEKPVIPSNETPATDVTKPEIPPTDGTAGNEEDPEMAQNGDCAAGATTPDEQKAYDYTMPVPESAAVDTSYFDDAVFIGDSRTEGFLLNTGLANTTGYCYKGLTVDTAFTNPVISKDGDKVSVMDALRTTNFSKVYIMLGINEAGWIYSDLFIQKYGQIIDEIRNINPDAQIYVQSILPVSQEVSEHHSYLTKTKIDEYNALLQQMAADKSVYYVNCKESVENEDGFLPAESAVDGIHLKRDACNVWLDYLLTHTVPVE